jgi:hypothetical protein
MSFERTLIGIVCQYRVSVVYRTLTDRLLDNRPAKDTTNNPALLVWCEPIINRFVRGIIASRRKQGAFF